MRARRMLVPVSLVGALLVAVAAVGRTAGRPDTSDDAKVAVFQWEDLADAVEDAALGGKRPRTDGDRIEVGVDVSASVAELAQLARQLERLRYDLDADELERRLEAHGVDVDELDIDLDDLEDHLEDLQDALADLAEYAAALDARLEIRVRGGRVVLVERERR